jgi:hypothetical protein
MRRFLYAAGFMVAFVLICINSSFAQEQTKKKMIFDYKAELNLTDEQVAKMKDQISSLNNEVKISRAKLTILDAEVRKLIENDGDMTQIKAKIKEAFDIQAQMRIADIEAARKINSLLSAGQLKKWRELQAAERKDKARKSQ